MMPRCKEKYFNHPWCLLWAGNEVLLFIETVPTFLKRFLTMRRNRFHIFKFFVQPVPQVHINSLIVSDSYSNIQMNFSTSSKELIRVDLISALIMLLLFSNLVLISWVAETTFLLSLYHPHYQSLMICAQRHSIFF